MRAGVFSFANTPNCSGCLVGSEPFLDWFDALSFQRDAVVHTAACLNQLVIIEFVLLTTGYCNHTRSIQPMWPQQST
jgi:hypothetical protein